MSIAKPQHVNKHRNGGTPLFPAVDIDGLFAESGVASWLFGYDAFLCPRSIG